MSDDLVKRLRSANDESFVETLCGEAANRIETLTAERDHAWEMAAKADTQMGQSLADNLQAKAERDRLREALQQFLIEYDEVDLAHAEPSSLTAAVLEARAALKGGTP